MNICVGVGVHKKNLESEFSDTKKMRVLYQELWEFAFSAFLGAMLISSLL